MDCESSCYAGDEAGTGGTAGKSDEGWLSGFIGWGTRGKCLRRCGDIDGWLSRLQVASLDPSSETIVGSQVQDLYTVSIRIKI